MMLHSGTRFYPLDPDPKLIKIEDIAHALALQCRFNGHTPWLYSVAQHSIYVEELINRITKGDVIARLVALLHDAAEAYLVDIPRPIKPYFQDYLTIEAKIQRAIWEAFDIDPTPYAVNVKIADEIILATEIRDVMRADPKDWEIIHAPAGWLRINPAKPQQVKLLFQWKASKLLQEKGKEARTRK